MKKIQNLQIASKQSFRCVKKLLIAFALVFGTTNALSAPPDLSADGPPLNHHPSKGTQYGSNGDPHSDLSPTGLQSPSGSGTPCPHPSSPRDATDMLHSHSPNPITDPCSSSRFRRNANADQTPVGRMQLIARVTNAISLQEGLKDGTLIPEEIVAELLYFGVSPDQINNIVAEELQKALDSLASLSDKLKKKEDVEKAEELYLTLFSIRQQLVGVVNREKWVHKDDLRSDLTTVQKDGLKVALAEEIGSSVKHVIVDLEKIVNNAGKKDDKRLYRFEELGSELETFSSKITELSESGKLDKIVMLPSGRSVNDSISDISKLSNAMNAIYDNQIVLSVGEEQKNNYNDNTELIETVSTQAENILSHLKTIGTVLQSRATPDSQRKLVNTAGFPKGDIWSLSNDFSNNQWLKELTDTKSLFQALTPFVTFGDFVQNINNGVDSAKKQHASSLSMVLDFINRLLVSRSTPGVAKTVTDGLEQCVESIKSSKIRQDTYTKSLRGEIHKIDSAMSTTKKSLEDLFHLWTTEEASAMIKGVRDIVSRASNDDTELQELAKELANYKMLKQFKKLLEDTDELIKSVKQSPIETLATEALKHFDGVKTLLEKVKDFDELFTCLLGISEAQPVYDVIAKSRELQKMTDPDRVSLKKGTDGVHQTLETLQKIKEAQVEVDKMKTVTSPESDALSLLLNPKTESNTIGSATRGIVSMQEAIVKKSEIDAVKGHLKLALDELEKAQKTQPLDKVDTYNHQHLQYLKEDLDKMPTALETWNVGIKGLDSTKLKDYSGVFSGAQNVAGIEEDLQELRDSVQKSAVLDPAKKKDLVDGLNMLISIGLELSDYKTSFLDAPETLGTLDVFFASYRTQLAPPTASPSTAAPSQGQGGAQSPGGQRAGAAASGQLEEATLKPEDMSTLAICGIVAVCLGILASIVVGIGHCCLGWWKAKPKQNEEDEQEKEQKPLLDQETAQRLKDAEDKNKQLVKEQEVKDRRLALVEQNAEQARKDADRAEQDAEKAKDDARHAEKVAEEAKKKADEDAKKQMKKQTAEVEKKLSKAPKIIILLPENGANKFVLELFQRVMEFQYKEFGNKDLVLLNGTIYKFCRMIHNCIAGVIKYTLTGTAHANRYQSRWPQPLHENTRVILDYDFYKKCKYNDDYIHASKVKFPDGKIWILAMAPFVPGYDEECPQSRNDDKFWVMILQNRTKFIVMLCNFIESGAKKACQYFPLKKGEVVTIDTRTESHITITCIEVEFPEEDLTVRTLEIRDVEDNITHVVTHKQYIGWPDHGAPKDPAAVARLFASIRNSKKVVIHCSAGLGRSGTIALMEFYYQAICIQWEESGHKSAAIDYGDLIRDVRLQRAEAVQDPIQVEFALAALIRFLFFDIEPKTPRHKEIYDNFMQCCTADFEADERGEFLVKAVAAQDKKTGEGKEKGTKKSNDTKSSKVAKSKKSTKSKEEGKKKPRAGDAPVIIDMEAGLKKAESDIQQLEKKQLTSQRTQTMTQELSQQRTTKTPK